MVAFQAIILVATMIITISISVLFDKFWKKLIAFIILTPILYIGGILLAFG